MNRSYRKRPSTPLYDVLMVALYVPGIVIFAGMCARTAWRSR